MFRHIREALSYVRADLGRVFVLKIGKDIMPKAEDYGVVENINQLHIHGIRIVVTHAVRDFDLADWPSLEQKAVRCGVDNLDGIRSEIANDKIPVIYCGRGQEAQSDRVAVDLAIELKSDKLLYLTDVDVVLDGIIQHQMTITRANELLQSSVVLKDHLRDKIESAVWAFQNKMQRVHIIIVRQEDALLGELLTSEGVGTMIYQTYSSTGFAKTGERTEITDIIRSAEFPQAVDLKQATRNIKRFCVRRYDSTVHGCVLHIHHKVVQALELAYLATSRIYEDGSDAEELLLEAIKRAHERHFVHLFMETAKTQIWLGIYPWFLRHGFKRCFLGEILPSTLASRDTNTEVWYTKLT
jgi:N-acetylglutamate synthase-like GNAT family acetyltransferase